MQAFLLRFHHFGLASRRPEQTLRFLRGLGHEVAVQVYDPLQNVNLWLCTHLSMPTVELVGPAEGQGPLDAILAASNESIYHLCYETENLDVSLAAMKAGGFRVMCVSAPKPAILFNNRRVSFYRVKDFGLIELLEPA
jgi:methylmalonyl-CoA/ethylmalonyl-CoA epimerase